MKKLFAAITSLVLVLGLTACGNETSSSDVASSSEPIASVVNEEAPASTQQEGIYAGIFEYMMYPEGREEMQNFFHFYENGVYYFSVYNGGQFEAGFFELVEEPFEFTHIIKSGSDDIEDEVVEDVAQAYFIFTDFAGNETGRYAYKDDTLWNYEPFYSNNFVHVPDADNDPAKENGVAVEEFIIEGDEYSALQLNHNGTFQDTIGMMVEGTWAKDGNTYTLTDEDSGESYTLVVNGDNADYTGLDGTAMTLVRLKNAEVQLVFAGSGEGDYGLVEITVNCLDDGTAELVVGVSGTSNASAGTWTMADDYSKITLELEGETYEAAMDYETQTFGFEMEMAGAVIALTNADTSEAALLLTFVGEENANVKLEMYTDGTALLVYEGMGTVSEGTWEMDTSGALPAFTIVLEEGELEVESDYATKFFFTYENEGGTLVETLALSFDDLGAALG